MKKQLLLTKFLMVFALGWISTGALGQCIRTIAYGNVTIPNTSFPVVVGCAFTTEFTTFNGVETGSQYTFTSSITTDFLTLTDASNNVLAFGTTPIVWTATFDGSVRIHGGGDASCSTPGGCRDIAASCSSCTPPPPGACIFGSLWGIYNAPTSPTPTTVSTCVLSGNYNTISNVVNGNSYEFASGIASDWFTLTDASNNIILFGSTPLTWTANFSGDVRLHVAANSSCGTDGSCRSLTLTCTSCTPPPPGACIHPTAFGVNAIPVSGSPISQSGVWAGEFTTFTGTLTGETYSFTSSGATDHLTLTDAANNILIFGTTPLTWTATFDGSVRVHVSVDSGCGTQNTGREITAQCTTCTPPPPGPCITTAAFATVNAPTSPTPLTISTCTFAGQYNTINNVVNGSSYQFASATATDWLTLTDASNNVIIFGATPLNWTADFDGTVRLHVSLNSSCDPQNACRTTTVTCTSCPVPPPGPCIQPTSFGTNTIPANGNPITTFGVWAGEFTNFTGVITGEDYSFSSSTASDWLTLTDASNNILVFGTTPLTWTATFSGAVRVHVSVDAGCGTQNTGRSITAQCSTCTPPPPGPGDNCANPLPLACGDNVTGNTSGKPTNPVDFCGTTNGTGGKVWYEFMGNGDIITASLCGSSYDTKIWVFEGLCSALNCVTGNDDACGLQSEVTFLSNMGDTYYVVVGGFGAEEGAYTLNLSCVTPPPPPACASNVTLTPTPNCDNYDISLTYDATPGATGYNIYAGTASGVYDIANPFDAGDETLVFLQNPSLNTEYFFLVVPYNAGGEAIGCTNEVSILTGGVGCACIPQYSIGKTSGDLISNVEIPGTTLANNTGTAQVNPAFTYFTGQPNYTADLVQGGSYNVTISVGTWGDQAIRAWIDYNDDGVFDDTESIGSTTVGSGFSATGFPPAVFNVNLSNSAPLGTHRMRIRGAYFQNAATLSPCLEYTFGETEDYDVTIVAPTTTQLQSNFCGATNVTMDEPLRAINVNAPEYRFRITGANNGGPGWNAGSFVHDSPNRAFKFAFIPGSLWGETYSVEVAVGDGFGNFGPYGAPCTVSLINNIPTTQLQAADCGATDVDPNTNLLAIKVTGSTGYRFQVNGPSVAVNTVVEKTMGGGAMRKLKMNQVAGVLQGETYTVEVAIRDAAGNWGAYGTACNVTVGGAPALVLNNDSDIFVDNKTTTLVEFGANASHNPFNTEFGLQVLNANDSETINVVIYDMSGKLIERHAVNPMDIENAKFGSNLASGMYMIEVRQGSNQAVIRQVKN